MARPAKFAHVVYMTRRYEAMIAGYKDVFEAEIVNMDPALAFLTYDDEHHRFAFLDLGPVPEGQEPPPPRMGRGPGVNHVAYTWPDLHEFVAMYKRLKAMGVEPVRPIRHGITLSMYYADPDGNLMEFQIDVLDPEAANAFMDGPAFDANPIGEVFDPDELVARYEAGASLDDVVFRSDQTPAPLTATPR